MKNKGEEPIREVRPNSAETEFLNLVYNRFYDLFDEMFSDVFWESNEADE